MVMEGTTNPFTYLSSVCYLENLKKNLGFWKRLGTFFYEFNDVTYRLKKRNTYNRYWQYIFFVSQLIDRITLLACIYVAFSAKVLVPKNKASIARSFESATLIVPFACILSIVFDLTTIFHGDEICNAFNELLYFIYHPRRCNFPTDAEIEYKLKYYIKLTRIYIITCMFACAFIAPLPYIGDFLKILNAGFTKPLITLGGDPYFVAWMVILATIIILVPGYWLFCIKFGTRVLDYLTLLLVFHHLLKNMFLKLKLTDRGLIKNPNFAIQTYKTASIIFNSIMDAIGKLLLPMVLLCGLNSISILLAVCIEPNVHLLEKFFGGCLLLVPLISLFHLYSWSMEIHLTTESLLQEYIEYYCKFKFNSEECKLVRMQLMYLKPLCLYTKSNYCLKQEKFLEFIDSIIDKTIFISCA